MSTEFAEQNQRNTDATATNDIVGALGSTQTSNPLDTASGELHAAQKPTHTSAIALLAVAAIFGGSLFFMHKVATKSAVNFSGMTIDYQLGSSAKLVADYQEILDDLRNQDKLQPVPLSQMRANPFQLDLTTQDPDALAKMLAEQKAQEMETLRQFEIQRQKEIQIRLTKLTLNSVMGGRSPVARISGRLVRIGDSIDDYFTVVSIHARSVALEAGGKQYAITMGED